VLGLGALPTAQAAKSSTSTASAPTTVSVEVAAAPHSKRAERAAAAEGAVAPPALSATPAAPVADQPVARGKHGRAPGPPPGPPPAGAGRAAAGSGAPPRRIDREASAPHARRSAQGLPTAEGTAATGSQSAAAAGDESGSTVEALARKVKKEKVKKEKVKKEKPSKEKGGKGAGGEEGKGSGSPPLGTKGKSGATVVSQPDVSTEAVAASASVTAPSPLVGTGPASITSVAPTAASTGLSGVRAQRATRATRQRTNANAGAAPSTGVVAPIVTPAAAAPAPAGASPAHKAAKASRAAAQPAIVKTFTRIVGVVPLPVRILIAALIALALALAVRSRLSSVRTRRLLRQRGQLLEDVGLLQAALLPVPPPRLGPVGTSVAYRPADGPGAGGDFYDVFGLDDGRLAVIVGDVSGHGREALPHTALVRFTVRAYLEAGLTPRKALQTAGSVLDRQLAGSFATVVAAVYHPRERTLTYSSAGHPPPLVLGDADGSGRSAVAVEPATACSAPPLGAGMRTGTRETVISVPGPPRLCFHTDGVTEARVGEDLFGAERLTVALANLSPHATAPALLDSVAERTDARPDDMAACLLRIEDGSGQPSIVRELVELDGAAIASGRAERLLGESGLSAAAAVAAIDSARPRLDRRDSVLLELTLGDGAPRVALEHDNVVHTATLAAVGAS
jgi:serine phosphatase RsbU (regulator of sigma subunit)